MEDEEPNTVIYKVNLENLLFEKKIIDYSIPTCLTQDAAGIIISGVKFSDGVAEGNTRKLDFNLIEESSTNKSFEQITFFDKNYYTKFGNKVYLLDEKLNQKSVYNFDSEKIISIIPYFEGLAVLTTDSNQYLLSILTSDFHIDFKGTLDILNNDKFKGFDISDDKIIISFKNQTIVYH
jgi:hypothetical protein